MLKILILVYKALGAFKHTILISIFGISSRCKHQPTCSQYFYQQLAEHGTIDGLWAATKRLLTCW